MASVNQAYILSHILSEFKDRVMGLQWDGLKVVLEPVKLLSEEVGIEIKVIDINANIYQNVNDKIRVDGKLIPRALPVICSLALFVSSKVQDSQLKAIGLILQEFRDNRKIDVGDFGWLNNDKSPLTIDSVIEPNLNTKLLLQKSWGQDKSLTLLFNINCCIDSKIAIDFVEVTERKIHMEKIDV